MDLPISPAPEERDWSELPWDALSVILDKIGTVGIIVAAQAVCRQWWKLALEPRVWRRINMENVIWHVNNNALERMVVTAIERSGGKVEEFFSKYSATDEILKILSERARELKRLHLISCAVSEDGLLEAIKNLSSLKELEITCCFVTIEVIKCISHSCPTLECFRLNDTGLTYKYPQSNRKAFAIAENMTRLRELQIYGNRLDNDGLHALLDGCPNLESLDLRHCFQVHFDEDLKNKCNRLKILRLPKDSTDDYPHVFYVDW